MDGITGKTTITNEKYLDKLMIAASQQTKEKGYWQKKLSGQLKKTSFPYDCRTPAAGTKHMGTVRFNFTGELFSKLMDLSNRSDLRMHMILVAGLSILLQKYLGHNDIIVGAPIYKQEIETKLINTALVLRNQVDDHLTFKELLLGVRKTIVEASENYGYPVELLPNLLNISSSFRANDFPLFDTALLVENIHDKTYLQHLPLNMVFLFLSTDECIKGAVEFNGQLYHPTTVKRITEHLGCILNGALFNINWRISHLEMLSEEEKKQLSYDFNDTETGYPKDKTIHRLFEGQVEKIPGHIAVVFGDQQLTCRELNKRANQLARLLRAKGVKPGDIVGLMVERLLEMIIGILGILKVGGAYLPLEPGMPFNRVLSMLEDCHACILLTFTGIVEGYSFPGLQSLKLKTVVPHRTPVRPQIILLDRLPFPDRSLVDYGKYHQYIGIAMAKHTMPILASRGCPYNCAYCHKIWPKKHITRTAENIFAEILLYYKIGVRRFVIVDDIFNLNIKNSRRFFQLVLEHGLDIRLFFPGGVRGDILTQSYIDLMMEAGTVNMMMALESASPRIQKLMGKNLKPDRFQENLEYIIKNHPQLILEVNIMMGFPTETEEEALMSMDFIKQHQWIDFPNLNILKIYANTDMEQLALENGISRKAIENSFNRAYHELPDTLPFDKSFVLKCQSDLLNEYFLKKERLLAVLPHQMKVLSEDEMVQKYDSYLPVDIQCFPDLLEFFQVTTDELKAKGGKGFMDEGTVAVPNFHETLLNYNSQLTLDNSSCKGFLVNGGKLGEVEAALRILLLDLSKSFSTDSHMLYDVIESPLGLMYLLTFLNQQFGSKIKGKIAHSRMDFDNYLELKAILEEFQPDVIGVRTLTFYKDFYHKTIAIIRQLGFDVPVLAGGPYATSDWKSVLQDRNIDLVVMGEGEITLAEIIGKMIENNGKLPNEAVLKDIPGIAYLPQQEKKPGKGARDILMLDCLQDRLAAEAGDNWGPINRDAPISNEPAYVIFTSGSTGKPKGILTTHANVTRVVKDTNYINITQDDRVLQLSNYAFDGSVFDIYGALLNGAPLVMMKKDHVLAADKLSEVLVKEKITVFFLTTALFNALVDLKIDCFAHTRKVLFGGEKVSVSHSRKALEYLGKDKLIHLYGPTETTVYATYYPIDAIDEFSETIPIGKPISNTTLYIMDKNMLLVPFGVTGEIYIGGRGLARGYLNNPILTAEKFLPHPYVKKQLLYKTGDLARMLPDGNIEFSGRIDDQVKIRGFRIELKEIEHQLLQHPQVKDAVVMAFESRIGFVAGIRKERFLSAYIVPSGELTTSQLRGMLVQNLPDYMIPAYFVYLDKIPLNPNGKVDRKALPVPQPLEAGDDYVAPGSEIEKKLVKLWRDILGIEEKLISIDGNFFDMGGHSLKAAILITRMHKEFNVKLRMAEIFQAPSIREMAQYISGLTQEAYTSIDPVEKRAYYPLSSAQKRLFFLNRMDPESTVYNIPKIFRLETEPNIEQWEAVFRQLIQRHESLRTSFFIMSNEPRQRVHDEWEFEIEYYIAERQAQSIEGNKERCAPCAMGYASAIKGFIRSFDLSQAPLVRVEIIKTNPADYFLLIDMHHIISDGFSLALLLREVKSLWAGEGLSPLALQYKDFTRWQNDRLKSGEMKPQEEYWLSVFEEEIPVLALPTDYPRPEIQDFEGSSIHFEMSREETMALNQMVPDEGVTMFMLVLGIFTVMLSGISSQEDIIVGTPVAGRQHWELEHIIGMFVNTLALRNHPNREKTFQTFIKEVKERTLDAFAHQEYQFEDLVEKAVVTRDTSRNPLFDVMFMLQNIEFSKVEIPGLDRTPCQYETFNSKFDLTLIGLERAEHLLFTFEYSTKLFKKHTIEKFVEYFKRNVSQVLQNPGIKLADIEIISEEEKRQVLYDFNDTVTDYPQDKTIPGLFAEQAAKTPDQLALIGQIPKGVAPPAYKKSQIPNKEGTRGLAPLSVHVTYNELNQRSDQLAYLLKEKGVQLDTIVGIMAERSPEVITWILGILKAGAAYLPIDPQYPGNRVNDMLRDSAVKYLVKKDNIFSDTIGERELFVLDFENLNFGFVSNFEFCASNLRPSNLAYVIYTSGSSGRPKGVLIEHHSVINLSFCQKRYFNITRSDRILQFSSLCFDASVEQIFITFCSGAVLVLIEKDIFLDNHRFEKFISLHSITHIHAVPSFLNNISLADIVQLKRIISGGDVCPASLVKKLSKGSDCAFYNEYGPTETTVTSVEMLFEGADEALVHVPIGKPIDNTTIYLFDRWLNLIPIGLAGEMYIGGEGVARGYLNNPELTCKKFKIINHEIHKKINKKLLRGVQGGGFLEKSPPGRRRLRIYKTGDLARWESEGNIRFLGRLDHQVKLRGYRIELGEIESRLVAYDAVKEAVVLAYERTDHDKYLCAFVVAGSGEIFEPGELREYLARELPTYMVPSYIIMVETIPLTSSGKINRKALPDPGKPTIERGKGVIPGDEVTRKLVEVWSEVLKIEPGAIGIEMNFFELGGHSLKAIQVTDKIHKALDVKVPLVDIFNIPTIRGLAEYIKGTARDRYISLEPVEEKEYYPLSSAQKRLYILQQMDADSISYNISEIDIVEGELEEKKIEETFRKFIHRHESLRTSFDMIGEELVQRIHDCVAFKIEYYCAMGKAQSAGRKEDRHALCAMHPASTIKAFLRPFNLALAPLIRGGIIKLGESKYIMMVDMHHMISDGMSNIIFIDEFTKLYKGKELHPLRIRYKDYSEWEMGKANDEKAKEMKKKQEDFWLKEFSGEIPVLNIPTDYERPMVQSFQGDAVVFSIEGALYKGIKQMVSETGATLFMVLFAVYNVLLFLYTRQQDIIIGTPVTGRMHADVQGIIGIFANMLALRNRPGRDKTFREFLEEVKENSIKAFDNQEYHFDELVMKLGLTGSSGGSPLFNIVFTLQNPAMKESHSPGVEIPGIPAGLDILPGFKIKPYRFEIKKSPYDLIFDTFELQNAIKIRITYATALFKQATIEKMKTYYMEIFEEVIADMDIKLRDIRISYEKLASCSSIHKTDQGDFNF